MIELPLGNIRLSVVVVIIESGPGDLRGLAAVLSALERQTIEPADEVIVPYAVPASVSALQSRFPAVRFLPAEPNSPAHSSERVEELRALGVAAAHGEIIALLEDHVRPDPDWSAATLEAHREAYTAIGGAIENGVDRKLNWAVYFSDVGRYHNPLPAGESGYASVVNASYKRAGLWKIRAVWQRRFNETAVHAALLANGEKLALSGKIVVRQYWPEEMPISLLRQFFTWGRSYGSTRARLAGPGRRFLYACLSPLIPAVLLFRGGRDTARKGRLMAVWVKSLPASVVLTVAWSCGELTGYVAGQAPAPRSGPAARQPAR